MTDTDPSIPDDPQTDRTAPRDPPGPPVPFAAGDEPVEPLREALTRLVEARDTSRAIGAGEVNTFTAADEDGHRREYTLTDDRLFRMFVENMRDGAATVSTAGIVSYANDPLATLLGCSLASIVGAPLARFVGDDADVATEALRGQDGRGATFETDLVGTAGKTVPVCIGSSPITVDDEELICLTFTDMSEQKAQTQEIARLGEEQAGQLAELRSAEAALTEQATHDTLTGLPNRVLLIGLIDAALARAKRSGGCTAVLFVDLDRFKAINDTQGHAAGDLVLRTIADHLGMVLRPADIVARIGGDEFVVLATDVTGHLEAADIGARLVRDIAAGLDRSPDRGRVSASIGISVTTGGTATAEAMLHEADTAMYKAKSLGGARAELFDEELGREVLARADAQRTLSAALDERRVVPHYQPIVTLGSGRSEGVEALARLVDADGSLVPPARFIRVAEASGLVVPLGAEVLVQACRAAAGWSRDGAEPCVSVNLSARQFDAGELLSVVQGCLRESGLAPHRLHLEITETAIMDMRPDVLKQLMSMREMGVEVGLDDFGTGYASLTHLRRLPLTFVKIDQTFVHGLGTETGDDRIVAAVIDLCGHLGLRSIGEGVETPHQLERLRELGCDQAQGYLFARPLPAGQVVDALDHAPW